RPCRWSPPPPSSTLFPYTTSSDLHFWSFGSWAPAPTASEPKLVAMPSQESCSQRLTVWGQPAVDPSTAHTPTHSWLRGGSWAVRSEEHTSELQSRSDLVCRLLLEK